jgi:hypothetical protein
LTELQKIASLDWQAPWWQPWHGLGQQLAALVQKGAAVHEALNTLAIGAGIRFVPQSALPESMAYETFIFESRCVPTRDNAHDFFNGLAWLRFPLIKARLNALQHAEICKHGVQPLRGALRDALTLFDENAAFLSADTHAPIVAALHARDWHTAFQTHRSLLIKTPPVLFGHALLEKLISPYKSVVAHVFIAPIAIDLIAKNTIQTFDECMAERLTAQALLPKPFVPLPVLGVPGWWFANESPDFYTDRTVFRAPRS